MKVKECCIALDNVGPYIDSVLGPRYIFLKGERASKEKVFSMIQSMTEEEYARYFRPATEEEINGEFNWDGEQYILKKETKCMKSIKEKANEYAREFVEPFVLYYTKDEVRQFEAQHEDSFEAGTNYVLDAIQSCIDRHEDGCLALEAIILTIEELKNK